VKSRGMCILFVSLATLSIYGSPVKGATYNPEIKVSIDRPIADPEFQGEGRTPFIVFGDSPVKLRVSLYFGHAVERRGAVPPEVPDFVLPSENWTDHLKLYLDQGEQTETGTPGASLTESARGTLKGDVGSRRSQGEFRLRNGEGVFVEYSVVGLSRGPANVRAVLMNEKGEVVSRAELELSVRNGNESPAVRQAYLRQVAERARTFEEFRTAVEALHREFPGEHVMMERLAERALSLGKIEDATGYYRLARQGYERALAERQKANPLPLEYQELAKQDLERLSVLDAVGPFLESGKRDVTIQATRYGGREWFVWVEKSTGRTLGPVDLKNPRSWPGAERDGQ